ncbi:hypothetical protein [Haloarchaeobius sp. HRN-SO-5]|uniref:hypothetical protein n=1 Tax=Haloarchaeobius sp. HRN-SO-5 TaxID=3446118 RepID=UPI003EBE2216
MSTATHTPASSGVVDLSTREVRALTRPMIVVEDDPQTWDADEVVVYHEDRAHVVNPVLGFCDCADAHYRNVRCQHLHRADYALGRKQVPGWVDYDQLDGLLRRRLDVEGAR